MTKEKLLAYLRIALGFVFLWTFLDNISPWVVGISPTAGFLKFGTEGPLVSIFNSLSGSFVVDVLFMGGMLLIGSALILGMGIKIAGYSGSLMMFLIYLSVFPPENNPFVDQHIIFILVLLLFTRMPKVGDTLGIGRVWKKTSLVKRYPCLA